VGCLAAFHHFALRIPSAVQEKGHEPIAKGVTKVGQRMGEIDLLQVPPRWEPSGVALAYRRCQVFAGGSLAKRESKS
jgi:hypothetical protein